MTTNVNPADLHIETDDAGFILGQSVLGDALGSEATVWMQRAGQVHSLTMTRAVTVNNGIQFEPNAASLSVVMPGAAFADGAMGKRLRIRWKNNVLFNGVIKTVEKVHGISGGEATTQVRVTALGITEAFNRLVLNDLTRPEETAGIRAASLIVSSSVVIETNNCNRLMAARAQSSVKLMTVLKETANTQLARFYIDKRNVLVLDGDPAPEPTISFSDDPAATGRTDYRSVQLRQDPENVITAITVKSKQSLKNAEGEDYQLEASARDTSAVVTHEELYEADLPLRQNQLDAWAQSFPLRGYTRMEPYSLVCAWQDELADLELTHLVSIQKDGRVYRSGVKAIKYDIKATNAGLVWTVSLDLMPGHLVEYTPVIAPSDVRAFRATAINDHRIDLNWQRPEAPNGLTGYEIRYLAGPTPPETRTQGTVLATVADDVVSYSHTGAPSATQFSYSIWGVTSNPAISSSMVSAGATTPETIPSAVQGFSAVKTSATGNTFNWSAPAAPGTDLAGYEIRYRSDGVNPTATTGTLLVNLPVGTTQHVGAGYTRNVTWNWGIFPKTNGGKYGPGAFAVNNTNETIPTAVTNLAVYADNYQSITAYWGLSSNTQDLNHYRLVRLENAYRAPESYDGPQYGLGTDRTSLNLQPVSMNTHHDIAVFPITHGGLVGPRANAWTDTPQGIFNQYWEGEAAWAQSYKGNGAPASFGSGSPQNLYYGRVEASNGHLRSMVGWNVPGNVQNCYAIDRVELHLYNLHTYNNSGADVDFGMHGWGGPPGSWPGGATGLARYRLNKPGWLQTDVTGWTAGHLAGGARGMFLGPNQSDSTAFYGYASGTAGSGPRPVLKIWYRTIG